jgi:hypothetical protein
MYYSINTISKTTLIGLVTAGMAYWIKRIYAFSWGVTFFLFLFLFLYASSMMITPPPS